MDAICASCGARYKFDPTQAANRALLCGACGVKAAVDSQRPVRLGKYLLLRRISCGGMGEVFYAKSQGVEGFERELAIKRILPHLSSDRSFVDMLVKEAKITVLLNHPNIVQVFDLAKEGNEYYLVMEYVPGVPLSTLTDYCRKHNDRLPVAVAVHIASLTLKGLAYAHALRGPRGEPMQILHRDVTPQNLLITKQGWVKITDFGIAKACNEISSTNPGTIKGKLGYIPPEVLRGQIGDQRIDLFSVGVLLWESLAGRRLFKGENDFETARLVTECNVLPVTSIREDVGLELESCMTKALARDPHQRYPDADAFYDALMSSVRPLTADDCARATEAFLADSEALFAGKLAHENLTSDPVSTQDTQELATRRMASEPSEAETRSEHPAARRSRHLPVAWIGGAVVLLAVAGAVTGYRVYSVPQPAQRTEPRPAPPAPTAVSEPPPPAPSTVPAPEPPPLPVAKPEATPTAARNRPAKPLGVAEIQKTVQRHYQPMSRCLRKLDPASSPAAIAAKLTITASGRVVGVQIEPRLSAAPARCLETALKSIRFRPGPSGFHITIPLNIEHVRR